MIVQGFGSIVVPRPNAMTKSIIKAVQKGQFSLSPAKLQLHCVLMLLADVRAIIAKGWSSRGGDPAKEGTEIVFPDNCFALDKVPHGWLFPRGKLPRTALVLRVQG